MPMVINQFEGKLGAAKILFLVNFKSIKPLERDQGHVDFCRTLYNINEQYLTWLCNKTDINI
jgi:hypothetical protein